MLKLRLATRGIVIGLVGALLALACRAPAAGSGDDFGAVFQLLKNSGAEAHADSFEIIGDNMVASGNVSLHYKEMILYANKAIFNKEAKDVELSGKVRFYQLSTSTKDVEYWELDDLKRDPFVRVKVNGTVMSAYGTQLVDVTVTRENLAWSGEKAAGNFTTGTFEFGKYYARFGVWQCLGDSAERLTDGSIEIKNAVLTTCDYITEGHDIYTVRCSRVVAFPHADEVDPDSPALIDRDAANDYSFRAYNCTFYLGDTPVFWLPMLYKPPRGNQGKWGIKGGYDSNWGGYVQTSNSWRLVDDPAKLETTNFIDFYSSRGVGVGNETIMTTQETKSELFMYGIPDWTPNMTTDENSRWDNPFWRYDLALSNLSHLSPRMDLRAHFEKISDINFFEDFLAARNQSNPQPQSFASLEYQFDKMSLGFKFKPQINEFFTEVEELPELRLDVQRQELFDNLYYQSQTSLSNLRMKWRKFDKDRVNGNRIDPSDYQTVRLDTVHFVYYPLSLGWLNLTPRAGIRATGYSDSSKRSVNEQALNNMLAVQLPDENSDADVYDYDDQGNGRLRFIPELGLEANTKISRTWDDAKNAFLRLDGIRHVMVPYNNYTMLFDPTVSRDKLYYFDDVDRINTQNFTRTGVENRLQTRRGSRKHPQIYTWASMNNYIDLHFNQRPGQGFPGDFGNEFKFHPHEDLTLTAAVLMNAGTGQLNKVMLGAEWEFIKDWKIFTRYNYGAGGSSPGAYSMGSSLIDLTSGTSFERYFYKTHNVSLGLEYEINERTRGVVEFTFDAQNHLFREGRLQLIRELPCHFSAILEYVQRRRRANSNNSIDIQHSLSLSLNLSSTPTYPIYPRSSPNHPENMTGRSVDQ